MEVWLFGTTKEWKSPTMRPSPVFNTTPNMMVPEDEFLLLYNNTSTGIEISSIGLQTRQIEGIIFAEAHC